MDEEIRESLANAIMDELNKLKALDPGSKEASIAADNATKLYKVALEDCRYVEDVDDKATRYEAEEQARIDNLAKEAAEREALEKKSKEDRIHRYIGYGIEVAGLVLPIAFYNKWMKRGLEFEKDGTYTSTTFRNLFSKFKPTRK